MKKLLAILLALALLCGCLPVFAESVADIQQRAAEGDPASMGYLGFLYYYGDSLNGNTLPEDEDLAFLWFYRGAMAGDPSSMDWIGYLFYEGIGTAPNPAQAVYWWEAALQYGITYSSSIFLLALLYQQGEGVAQDLDKAEEYFWMALEEGFDPWDAEEYLKWSFSDMSDFDALVLDAWDGDVNAMTTLGYLCYSYYDDSADMDDLALSWWEKAAESGLFVAMYNTAHMYYCGFGTQEDEAEARRWIHRLVLGVDGVNPDGYEDGYSYWDDYEAASEAITHPTPTPRPAATAAPQQGGTIGSRIGGKRGNGSRQATATPQPSVIARPGGEPVDIDPGRPAEVMAALGLDALVEAYADGDLDAGFIIGWCFANGEGGLERDDERAFEWWLALAQEDYIPAFIWLADAYYYGLGTPRNPVEAFTWYRQVNEAGDPAPTEQAAPTNNAPAASRVDFDIDPGRPAEVMAALGLDALVEAYADGDLDAGYIIAWCFANGEGGLEKDERIAFEWWLPLAQEDEDPRAYIWVAEAYFYGRGVAVDYEKAIEWYKVIALEGNDEIMNKVGMFYVNGKVVAQDYAEALSWFLMAAEEGNVNAIGNAAQMYNYGWGTAQDLPKAFAMYKEAAEGGNSTVWNNLGVCYLNGRGTAKDTAQGAYWITKAAEAGNAAAMDNLGQMYEKGVGVKKDANLAYYWYQKAAEAGNAHAQTKIGK